MNEDRILSAATGVVATTVTPFRDDGSLDLPALRRNVAHMVEAGVDMIVPCGNTAEHSSLDPDEVRTVARETIATADGASVVVVGVGGPLPTVRALAADLQRAGADGVMVHQPAHVHASTEGVRLYLEAICDAAPHLAVFPYKKSSRVMPDEVLEAVLERPNLLGVKYAEPDVRALRDVVRRTAERYPGRAWINGLAETWVPAFASAGAPGFTSGLVNVAPRLSTDLRDALRAGDAAGVDRIWELVKPFEYLRARHDSAYNVPVVKEAGAQLGLFGRTVRPPLTPVASEDAEAIGAILRCWGLA